MKEQIVLGIDSNPNAFGYCLIKENLENKKE